jgi:hypothetical protein
MPDVHGRPAAMDIKAASNCDHAHVRVVTVSAGAGAASSPYLMSAHPPGYAVSCMCKPFSWGFAYRKLHCQVGERS